MKKGLQAQTFVKFPNKIPISHSIKYGIIFNDSCTQIKFTVILVFD